MKLHHVLVASALFATGPLAAHVASAQQVGTHRTELQRHDLSTPGLEVIQVRVDLDPGTVAPPSPPSRQRDHLCPRRDLVPQPFSSAD